MRFLLAIFLLLTALPAYAQNLQRALVVSACGLQALPAGPLTNLTMNPAGQLCIGGSVAPPPAPVNSVAPVASGALTVGSLLSSTTGTWTNSPTSYAYQWQRGGTNISGATSSTYTTVTADGGTSVGSQVTATNSGGSASALSNTLAIAAAYAGPGDVVGSATAWYGLRAYSGAYAATPGKAVNLRRASDNANCDFNVATSGGFGLSATGCAQGVGLTPAAFATQDATASCTIATNTATCTGASSTPHVGSTVAGAGVGLPCYVTSVGTFTSGAGTLNLTGGLNTTLSAPCGTVGSATPLTFTYGLYAPKLYDQSGATNCTTACDAAQVTAAKQPQFLPSCLNLNTLPCLSYLNSSSQNLISAAVPTALTTIFTLSAVAARTAGFTTAGRMIGSGTGSLISQFFYVTANTVGMIQSTSNILVTAADSAWHAVQSVFKGDATSFINVNGVSGAPASGGTASWGTSFIQLGSSSSAFYLTGYMTEDGIWNTALSSGQLTSLCHNQFSYWGTSASC